MTETIISDTMLTFILANLCEFCCPSCSNNDREWDSLCGIIKWAALNRYQNNVSKGHKEHGGSPQLGFDREKWTQDSSFCSIGSNRNHTRVKSTLDRIGEDARVNAKSIDEAVRFAKILHYSWAPLLLVVVEMCQILWGYLLGWQRYRCNLPLLHKVPLIQGATHLPSIFRKKVHSHRCTLRLHLTFYYSWN